MRKHKVLKSATLIKSEEKNRHRKKKRPCRTEGPNVRSREGRMKTGDRERRGGAAPTPGAGLGGWR